MLLSNGEKLIPEAWLENDHVCLRPLLVPDITDEYISGLNDPEVNRYLVDVKRTVQTYNSVMDFVILNRESPSCILFGIFKKGLSGQLIGTVRVSGMEFFHFTASIGICLFARQDWGKGYASQSLALVKEYMFSAFGLHYLEAGVYAKNMGSYHTFTKAGFAEKFRADFKYRLDDSFEQVIFLASINPEFDMSSLKRSPHKSS
jgi:RimJ/RimL family protein N-acetyltransferase